MTERIHWQIWPLCVRPDLMPAHLRAVIPLSFPHGWHGSWLSKIEMPNWKTLRQSKLCKVRRVSGLTQTDLRELQSELLWSAWSFCCSGPVCFQFPREVLGRKWPDTCCFRVFFLIYLFLHCKNICLLSASLAHLTLPTASQ